MLSGARCWPSRSATTPAAPRAAPKKLAAACEAGDAHAVAALLASRAHTAAEVSDALFCALVKGREACMMLLIDAGAGVNAVHTKCGHRPLAHTCANGHVRASRLLINARADVNAAGAGSLTPLHIACRRGSANSVELLIRAGAYVDVGAYDPVAADVITPLRAALDRSHGQCAALLLRAGAQPPSAEEWGDGELEKYLLSACRRGDAASVRLLVDAGADVNRPMERMRATPLQMACASAAVECARLLLRARAAVDFSHDGLAPPLFTAAAGAGGVLAMAAYLGAGSAARADERIALLSLLGAHGAACALPPGGCRFNHRTLLGELGREELAAVVEEARPAWAEAVGAWLRATARWTTPLHHLAALTEAEAIDEIVRTGADVHAGDGAPGAPTPASIAGALYATSARGTQAHATAAVVLAASRPWSRERHHLWPRAARARVAQLLTIGYQLARSARLGRLRRGARTARERDGASPGGGAAAAAGGGGASDCGGRALVDVWVEHVLPHAVHLRDLLLSNGSLSSPPISRTTTRDDCCYDDYASSASSAS